MKELNEADKANLIARDTFLPKIKNLLRYLDDHGYKGNYTHIALLDAATEMIYDRLELTITGYPSIIIDLTTDATIEQLFAFVMRELGVQDA